MYRTNTVLAALSSVALTALMIGASQDATANEQHYVSGDFHNHTTCSDGSTSVRTLIDKSVLTYDLDWFSQSGHGGAYARDCRFNDPEYDGPASGEGQLWVDTIGVGAIKGDPVTTTFATGGPEVRAMWRWQSIQEFNYPEVFKRAKETGKVVFQGLETIVPGHEHTSATIIARQFPYNGTQGNANALAEFEYLFDRADNDMSGGGGQGWGPKISNDGLVGDAAHAKAVESVKWMQANYQKTSFNVPAHVERAGAFSPTGNAGWNIEHFRDYNNVGPDVSFGFESQPGHQAVRDRGGYSPSRSAGGGTYGGTGYYAATVGGMWDALLGEGRNWWFFASSDWHNRGEFSPFESATTGDFWPGEYTKTYILRTKGNFNVKRVVDLLRRGNSYAVQGDLIGDDLFFGACPLGTCGKRAFMGDTLVVPQGADVLVTMVLSDPSGTNHSAYSFPNPVLKQVGVMQPLNAPVLDHVDFITGDVNGKIDPSDPNYTNPTNPTTKIAATFNAGNWREDGEKRTIRYVIRNVQHDLYLRARGTNLPVNTPNATDADGNPLPDTMMNNVTCDDPACPAHLDPNATGTKIVDADVEAWSNIWFYTNPIYIKVQGSTTASYGNGNEIQG
jgi:hypothetical protein